MGVGCGEPVANEAPILDSVEAPFTVPLRAATYAIPVTLLFHDNDFEAVTRVRYRLPPNIDAIVDVPTPNPTRESARVTLLIRAADIGNENENELIPSAQSDRDNAAGREETHDAPKGRRNRTRLLQISVVDARGAESLPQPRALRLD